MHGESGLVKGTSARTTNIHHVWTSLISHCQRSLLRLSLARVLADGKSTRETRSWRAGGTEPEGLFELLGVVLLLDKLSSGSRNLRFGSLAFPDFALLAVLFLVMIVLMTMRVASLSMAVVRVLLHVVH